MSGAENHHREPLIPAYTNVRTAINSTAKTINATFPLDGFMRARRSARTAIVAAKIPLLSAVLIPHLNFSVVSANSANTSARIQNRAITFDSDHPPSSK